MTLLLLGLAVAAAAFVLHRREPAGTPVPLAVLLLVYLAPALFLVHTLSSSRDAATRYRAALLGVGFRGEADRELRIPIGGDRDADGVWVSALDAGEAGGGRSSRLGHLVFRPPVGADDPGTLFFEPAETVAAGLLGMRRPGEALAPLRATDLRQGDQLILRHRAWTVDLETGLFGPPAVLVSGDHRVELPKRYGELPLGLRLRIWSPLAAVLQTHPLAWLEKAAGDQATATDSLFWRDGALWVTTTDPAFTVQRGESLFSPEPRELDGTVHVLSRPRWDGNDFTAGGFRDRRSLRPLPGRRSFALAYDTPEIVVLTAGSLDELAISRVRDRERQGDDAEPGEPGESPASDLRDEVRLNLSMGGWQVTDKSLYFRHASRRIALEALATLTLARDGSVLSAATPRGQRHGRFGEPIWLGGESLAAVQIDLLRPSVALGLLALFLAVLKALAARAGRLSGAQLLLAAPIEVLVTLRLLLGYRVWVLPPFAEEAYELALVAWALLPWAFLLASAPAVDRRDRRGLVPALPALGGAVFALAWCWSFSGGLRALVWAAALVAALVVWLARATGALGRLAELLDRRLEAGTERRTLLIWTGVAFVPGLVRIVLLFFGNRESLLLGGQRFALTLVHLPVALILEAVYLVWLWRRTGERGRLAAADLVPALALLTGTWLVPALFVSDLGLALLNVPVFLIALSSVSLATGRRLAADGRELRSLWLHAVPAAALALFILVAALPLGARAVLAVIPEKKALELESERNYLRLLSFAYPQRLESVARRTSEELSVMSTVMRTYTSGPFGGRGWFGSELSPHILATALREHAPAVFVAAEWGLAGILGVLLAFLVLGSSGRDLVPWRDEDVPSPEIVPVRSVASVLAALTLSVPSVYMIFANYRLTLFTGKNTYLFGLDSTADVLEVFLLMLLFAVGAGARRDAEDLP